jgi:tetratricopeptide (TPR) repeat protein
MGRERRKGLAIAILLVVATVAAYWRVMGNGFIDLDDKLYIIGNTMLQRGWCRESLAWAFGLADHSTYWHPLTWLSLLLDYEFFGLNPAGYHAVNLLLHVGNALLLFHVLRRLTGRQWPSAFVAFLFALHPLNVESVAWAVERKTVLSSLFWMLSLWAYLRYAERPGPGRFLVVCLAMAAGLMAKSMLVSLPLVLLLLDYWPLGRLFPPAGGGTAGSGISPARPGRCLVEKLPLFVLSAASVAVSVVSARGLGGAEELLGAPLGLRVENALVSYAAYIGKMIWPTRLAVFYPLRHSYPVVAVAAAALLLAAVTLLAWQWRRRFPWLLTGWFWYLGCMFPVIGLVRAGVWPAMADRFAYLPLIGLFVIVAWGGAELCRALAPGPAVPAVPAVAALLVLVAFFALTVVQTGYWRNDVTLFEHTLSVTGDNELALGILGMAYLKGGRDEAAVRLLKRQKELRPDSTGYDFAAASVLFRRGELVAARDTLLRAISTADNELSVLSLLAQVYEALHDYGNAIDTYNRVVAARQVDAGFFKEQARQGLARLLPLYAPELDRLRRTVAASPGDLEARGRLALRLDELGLMEEAFSQYGEMERRGMREWQLYYNLATAANKLGRYGEAVRYYELTLTIRPSYPDALNNLGLVFKETGRYDRAIETFQRAIASSRENAYPLYNLGVTYLKAGKKGAARDCFLELSRRFPAYADRVAPYVAGLGPGG